MRLLKESGHVSLLGFLAQGVTANTALCGLACTTSGRARRPDGKTTHGAVNG